MPELMFCFSIDDVAYDGYSTEEHLADYIDFCNEMGMKSTLFTVPLFNDVDFRTRSEYISILKGAISQGHEVGQHGIRHDRFETGVPPAFILALPHEGPARERMANERDVIDRENSVEKIRERLVFGRGILEEALDQKIFGYRGGAGSSCPNLYSALAAEGYNWDSSQIVQETGWDYIMDNMDVEPKPITRDRFDSLQFNSSVKVLPISTDYTWYLTKDKYEASLNLAKHDLDACLASGVPFVPVCHVSPIQDCEDGCGFKLYRELVAYAKDVTAEKGAKLSFLTLSEASSKL